MTRKFYTPIDLTGLEIQNVRIQNLASAPATPAGQGQVYYNTTNDTLFVYDGTAWQGAGKIGAGPLDDRPLAGSAGRLYFASDLAVLFYDNGNEWAKAGVTQTDFDAVETRVDGVEFGLTAHTSDSTDVHGISDTADLAYQTDLSTTSTFSASGELYLAVGTHRLYAETNAKLSKIRAAVGTPASGSDLVLAYRVNGTKVGEVTIDADTHTATEMPALSVLAGSFFTIDIEQVGSVSPGADLTVTLTLTKEY